MSQTPIEFAPETVSSPREASSQYKRQQHTYLIASGLQFYADVFSRLEENVKQLGKIKAAGSVSRLDKPGEKQLRGRLDLRSTEGAASITYTDIFYTRAAGKV